MKILEKCGLILTTKLTEERLLVASIGDKNRLERRKAQAKASRREARVERRVTNAREREIAKHTHLARIRLHRLLTNLANSLEEKELALMLAEEELRVEVVLVNQRFDDLKPKEEIIRAFLEKGTLPEGGLEVLVQITDELLEAAVETIGTVRRLVQRKAAQLEERG